MPNTTKLSLNDLTVNSFVTTEKTKGGAYKVSDVVYLGGCLLSDGKTECIVVKPEKLRN